MTATATVSNIRKLRVTLPASAVPTTKEARLKTVPLSKDSVPIEFVFPFTPIEITYEGLAPEWVSVDRPLNTPLIDLKGYNLLRVNLRFLIAVPFDGVTVSIDNDIRTLRSIANAEDPVAFVNMDRMLTNPFNVARLKSNRTAEGFFFRVADMSINSMRRNLNNEITSAEVSITLQETANPPIRTVYFEQVTYKKPKRPSSTRRKRKKKEPKQPQIVPYGDLQRFQRRGRRS